VVSLSTLDHFERATDIEASLRELARVQPAGGRLLLTLDNPANPEVALRRLLPRGLVRRLRADTFYLGETVGERRGGRLLTDAGYEVERVAYLIHALRYPAIRLLRWVDRPRLTGLRRIVEGLLLAAETLDKLPTRGVTGHYVAWVSRKNG
ncbi:MAG: hypothetical protein ACRDHY_10380, partial [Anaerolineales bacterium]